MDIICISSQVAYGPVGNSAAVPALEHAGFTVFQLPTTILSNHPGHCPPAATDVSAETLEKTMKILEEQNWLDHWLPVAEAIRDKLMPLADIITPNRFELQWLTGTAVTGLRDAVTAARSLPCPVTLATSLPASPDQLQTAVIERNQTSAVTTAHRPKAPHGAGDILSGLFLAAILDDGQPHAQLGQVMASLEHILAASGETGTLALPAALNGITGLTPLPVETMHD
jgi:pyridoxine kinase